MQIKAGQELLHYRLTEKLGEGGMGVVWKAVDTTLDREVAIKFLPDAFASDPERLARFQREAKLLASLNHPNIATVHGLHEVETSTGSVRFLAMELVSGEDLSQRLARGAMTVERVLRVGVEVASALEAAHAQGVIHRDLKPANVVVADEGQAKVLDFGLAKTIESSASSDPSSLSMSPTATSAGTVAGVILGTAAYMSPEQARGRPVDRRSDLWSLGCLLYECLTGRGLFAGETVSDSLAAILRKDPDWSALPAETPAIVRRLLQRLLARDPARRMQDAGDVRLELEEAIADPRGAALGIDSAGQGATESRPAWRERVAWGLAAVALVAAVAVVATGRPAGEPSVGVSLTLPNETADYRFASLPIVSPDGRTFVFRATSNDDDQRRLWRRSLDSFEAQPIAGSEGARAALWSHDGRRLAFWARGKLWTVDFVGGGAPRTVAALARFESGTWNADDQIVFSQGEGPLWHVPAAGGTPRPLTQLNPEFHEVSHVGPTFLPDGDRFLYLAVTFDPAEEIRVRRLYAGSLETGESTFVGPMTSSVSYVEPGYLFYVDNGTLMAVSFDAGSLKLEGEPQVIHDGVDFFQPTGTPGFEASANGTIAFRAPSRVGQLMWYDLSGRRLGPVNDVEMGFGHRISPDGARVATAAVDPRTRMTDVWVYGLNRETSTRITFDARWEGGPVWSADGSTLYYSTDFTGWPDVYATSVDAPGTGHVVWSMEGSQIPTDVSSDGRYLVIRGAGGGTRGDVWALRLPIEEGDEPIIIAGTPGSERGGRLSPDDEWIAYASDESGTDQIYVTSFPEPNRKVQISTENGFGPVWSRDGLVLYYGETAPCPYAACNLTRVMSVDLARAGAFDDPQPRLVFETRDRIRSFELAPDGERLLADLRSADTPPVKVILDARARLGDAGM